MLSTGSHLHDCCLYTFCASIIAAPIATVLITIFFAGAAVNDVKLKLFATVFFSGIAAGEEIIPSMEEEYQLNTVGNNFKTSDCVDDGQL